ncbi:sugar ABC transporter ATP-binding protein [Mesorhizobium sp. M3A.F.Ca.ET.201.01.1.1]|uniref:sugar ABC transporter ATP-binding protein n=1 Tax=Mesorhizobium sp. M3A.F.Ca.ET.201.01.1.1 TaxID=2563946 RepID=UPI0010935324|nr:sugar ABC transporter ATP-binding protein [Mesorhizobium sp. M3A.F.Ca.ET.201.01.1.1]TGS65582.1 sugar ABC transporter ATP-binding protein [Mesorhizobium sp. M3A.F.Ca.ET.201.01.1.1]
MEQQNHRPVVEFQEITKEFAGTPVLRGINLSFHPGEVHGLLGENGAGKSTLIKILTGVYGQSSGRILIEGQEARIHAPIDAQRLGLGAIYQDAELVPSFTVAENMLLGHEPGLLTVSRSSMVAEASRIIEEMGLDLDPMRRASTLSAAEMQLVMLGTILHRRFKLVVLDEPTARLSSQETKLLFGVIRNFQKQGIAVIYISHRLNEIKELCDRATILRGGAISATLEASEITEDEVTRLMVDRNRSELEVTNPGLANAEVRLSLSEVSTAKLKPLSLEVRSGEVVGITGPVGAGMEEIERVLGGLTVHSGGVRIYGVDSRITDPISARNAGIALIPEDRRKQALFPNMSVCENVALPVLRSITKAGFVANGAKRKYGEQVMNQLNVNPRDPNKPIRLFSGGNQQKAVIGKWLNANAEIYVFSEPTAGVDVGAIADIYEVILRVAREGAAVLVISSSLREILALSETIMVVYGGEKVCHLPRSAFDYDRLLAATMTGKLPSNTAKAVTN